MQRGQSRIQAFQFRVAAYEWRTQAFDPPPTGWLGLGLDEFEHSKCCGLAFDGYLSQIAQVITRFDAVANRFRYQDLTRIRCALKPCRHVHRIPNGKVFNVVPRTNVAQYNFASVNPYPHLEVVYKPRQLRPVFGHAFLDIQGRSCSSLRVILVGEWSTEKGQDTISQQLSDSALITIDGFAHPLVRTLHDLPPLLGVELIGDRGGANDVGE